jgi:hypothetical protein
MSDLPRWLQSPFRFAHRDAVEATLKNGGSLRPGPGVHAAQQLAGLYQIRLNIARDPKINPTGGGIIDDLAHLVAGLNARAGGEITAWFIRDAHKVTRFWIFEDRSTGDVVGCLNFDATREPHAV